MNVDGLRVYRHDKYVISYFNKNILNQLYCKTNKNFEFFFKRNEPKICTQIII